MNHELSVSTGQYSDKGRKAINQDFHGLCIPEAKVLTMKGIAVALADGISSSDVSQIASETAVKTFLADYYCTSDAWSVKNSMLRVLSAINGWLHGQTMSSPLRYDKDKGYVCTLSTLVIKNNCAHIFHVGDSRIYRFNQQGFEQLTNDHRVWLNNKEESYLTRAIGIEDDCQFDHRRIEIKVDDIFILSTDGVHEFIEPDEINAIIDRYPDDLNLAAKTIAEQAYDAGSDDNLTIQIVRIDQLPSQLKNKVKDDISALPFPPSLDVGIAFDGYEIIRKIHTSSRSHVYLAQDKSTQKQVVIKAPAIDLKNNEHYLELFIMEEWIAARISNGHVGKSFAASRKRNYLYTVFEYIEGQTLAQWQRDNPNSCMDKVRDIISQVAKGLQAFHRMEMLHQDLRPENIMIDQHGTIKLIDFGAVSVTGMQETLIDTPATYLLGTALYSAPEYFLGEVGDTRSEQFSLAVLCYFLLSGKYPYGTNVAKCKTLAAQRALAYQTVLSEDKNIPSWVDYAIKKAVHPLPSRRYEELSEFIHDLHKPSITYINQIQPPLIERNPVAFWQGVSVSLTLLVIYLLGVING
ncbi:MAG: bifunctional protein-serine/threonine kinase/phosphatase [Colwellia sp.]|nr:bifunctional protein-serine/threonine kinase/phosphatase [Colwellia sp.]